MQYRLIARVYLAVLRRIAYVEGLLRPDLYLITYDTRQFVSPCVYSNLEGHVKPELFLVPNPRSGKDDVRQCGDVDIPAFKQQIDRNCHRCTRYNDEKISTAIQTLPYNHCRETRVPRLGFSDYPGLSNDRPMITEECWPLLFSSPSSTPSLYLCFRCAATIHVGGLRTRPSAGPGGHFVFACLGGGSDSPSTQNDGVNQGVHQPSRDRCR